MTTVFKASLLGAGVILGGCAPSRGSTADTTVAVSSTTSVTATPVDSPTAAATGATTTTGSKTTAASTTTKTTVTTTKKSSETVQDPNIIGRDRVLRFPRRTLPTASSTPQR